MKDGLTFRIPRLKLIPAKFGQDVLIDQVKVYKHGEFLKDANFNIHLLDRLVGELVRVGDNQINHKEIMYRVKRWTLTDGGILLHMVTRYENMLYKGHQKLNETTLSEINHYGHLFFDTPTAAQLLEDMQKKNPHLRDIITKLDLHLVD